MHAATSPHAQRGASTSRSGFTLVELLVAVAILVVVIAAVGKIFGTVSKVTAVGESTSSFLQAAPAVERQIRRDFERLSQDGFIVIRNIRVRNDVNRGPGDTTTPLLDPTLADTAFLRADQLLFFAQGVDSTSAFSGTDELSISGNQQAAISRVMIGHGFQMPESGSLIDPTGFNDGKPLVPWAFDFAGDPQLETQRWPSPPFQQGPRIYGTQPSANEWVLARQRVLLADDGASPLFFGSNKRNSTGSIWRDSSPGDWASTATDDALVAGRVDFAGSTIEDIRRIVLTRPDGTARPWSGVADSQRAVLSDALYTPRAERVAPSMLRDDQFLVGSSLGVGISSFIVDWTWDHGVGRVADINNNSLTIGPNRLHGVAINRGVEQPWFGMSDAARNVWPAGTVPTAWNTGWANNGGGIRIPIFPGNIEQYPISLPPYDPAKVEVYEAVFGFNQYVSLDDAGNPDATLGFTPWPSSIRLTMVVSDPKGRNEAKREVQFVLRLPKR